MAAITLVGMKNKYGEIEGEQRYQKWKNSKKGPRTLSRFIEKYGEIEGEKIYEDFKKKLKKRGTLQAYIGKYGEIEGEKKYKEKNKKLSVSVKSLKLNGYTDEEIQNIREKHSNKSARTLDNFIKKYGEYIGKEKHNEWIKNAKLRSQWCKEYWVNKGYSLKEAIEIVSEKQNTSSLDKFIQRYGKEIGTSKYANVNKIKTRHFFGGNTVSKLEKDFFKKLSAKTYISDNGTSSKLNFNKKQYTVDYLDVNTNRIVEINGDFWHMNPLVFEATDINPVTRKTAKEIWNKENERYLFLKNYGYDILVIWEFEIKENYKQSLIKAKTFLEKK